MCSTPSETTWAPFLRAALGTQLWLKKEFRARWDTGCPKIAQRTKRYYENPFLVAPEA
jgi:hypothetical protein